MTFDYFEAGMDLGSRVIDARPLVAEWAALFPLAPDAAKIPAGLLVSIMMRGYLSLLDGRPKGNVHAGQRLRFGPPAGIDAMLTVATRCTARERRRDKPWLTFVTTVARADGAVHLEGEMRSLWSA